MKDLCMSLGIETSLESCNSENGLIARAERMDAVISEAKSRRHEIIQ